MSDEKVRHYPNYANVPNSVKLHELLEALPERGVVTVYQVMPFHHEVTKHILEKDVLHRAFNAPWSQEPRSFFTNYWQAYAHFLRMKAEHDKAP